MGCHDCHTPKVQGPGGVPQLDTKNLLSGHPADLPYPTWTPADLKNRSANALINPMLTAWAGPWGVSFAINLTPDKETGIAEWSVDVHSHNADRKTPGSAQRPRHPAADAMGEFQGGDGRGPEGDLGVLAQPSPHQEPGPIPGPADGPEVDCAAVERGAVEVHEP